MTENKLDRIEEQIYHFRDNYLMFNRELKTLLAVESKTPEILARIRDTHASMRFMSSRIAELMLQRETIKLTVRRKA